MKKVQIRRLPITSPPLPETGGRIQTPAGELAQVVNGPTFRHLAYMEFLPDSSKPRGNHYHREKTELLYIISGRLRAVYKDLESEERLEVELHPGDLVTVAPHCAHAYYALEHSQAVEMAEHPFDPTDTYPYQLDSTG